KVCQDLVQRRVRRDPFQNSALPGSKEFFLFRFGDIPADNDTAHDLTIGSAQRPAVDPRPKPHWGLRMPDEHLDTVRLLASNRPRQRRLIAREKRHFVRQVETTSPRPVRRSGVSRAFAEHALRRGIEDEKFLVPVRYDHGITHVGQDRLENLVDLGEVACCLMPVHESLPYPTLEGYRKYASVLYRLYDISSV